MDLLWFSFAGGLNLFYAYIDRVVGILVEDGLGVQGKDWVWRLEESHDGRGVDDGRKDMA